MARLGDIVQKMRSKNAGPFWLTIDIFCGTTEAYAQVTDRFGPDRVAAVFEVAVEEIKYFALPDLKVVKFSLPRPAVQGSIEDRDMHGASWAALLAEEML